MNKRISRSVIYASLAGAIACGPDVKTTVFHIDTDECRIQQAETPWLNIEIRYDNLWTNRGQYNAATGEVRNVQHNHEMYASPHDEASMADYMKGKLTACAENDPERQKRPVGFVLRDTE